MKKFLLLITALFSVILPSSRAMQVADLQARYESCEAVLQRFMSSREHAIPTPVLQKARALIITNQFKAGIGLGVKGGYGIIMVRRADNSWSIPVLIKAREASLGLQLGAQDIETIFVLTDDVTPKKLFDSRLNIGVDAKAVAGPKWAEIERVNKAILETPVLVYTRTKGLFAGATVKAGYVGRDDDANRVFYSTSYTLPELLYGDFVTPPKAVGPLMEYVRQIAP